MNHPNESFLSISDLFLKARPSPAHPPPARTSQSNNPARSHSHGRIMSFVGQVVHAVSATNQDNTIILPDPLRFPVQRQALRLFRKKSTTGQSPDVIVWLAAIVNQEQNPDSRKDRNARSNTDRSRNKGAKERKTKKEAIIDQKHIKEAAAVRARQDMNQVVLVLSSDEHEHDSHSDGHETSSAVSWSDSGRSASSDAESSSDDEPSVDMEVPGTMVAVLLDRMFDQEKQSLSKHPASRIFKRRDLVQVSKAVMLFEELDGRKVVSCVGIPDRTTFKITSRPWGSGKERQKQQDTTAASGNDLASRNMHSSGGDRQQFQEPKMSNKRTHICSGGSVTEKQMAAESEVCEGRSKRTRLEVTESEKSEINMLVCKQPQTSLRDPDALELLERKARDDRCSRTEHTEDKITYLSTLWSDIPIRVGSPACSRSSTPSSNHSSRSSSRSHVETDTIKSSDKQTTITRHICWLTRIRYANVRAVCADCGNDYKNLCCVFGCRSRKWRLDIRMECAVSDGTAEADLLVLEDQEETMWALLGLMTKTDIKESDVKTTNENPIASVVPDPHEEVRNKVLRIIARRGELSFKTDSPLLPASASLSSISKTRLIEKTQEPCSVASAPALSRGFVDSINMDRSQRARIEEQLWLKICTSPQAARESLLLRAILNTASQSGALLEPSAMTMHSVATRRSVKLKTSFVRMNAETNILTLVRPPLVLRAIDVKRIRPKMEARMLLDQLRGNIV
ncbi:hypothetical protein BGX28_007718 [Mortierella sp. GBA30]|nr:hypothetical protein BGX28_007718 [Mortierella sp. GBA30]